MTTATMCERGQITIPKQFRDRLGFMPGMVFVFKVEGKSLKMSVQNQRLKALDEVYGSLDFKKEFGDITTDELIAEMRGR